LILVGDTVINIYEPNHAQIAPSVRWRGIVMRTTNRLMCWIIVLGLAANTPGCNREPPVTPPPPLEVVVSKPITNEAIEDWDVYTGTVEAKDSVPIQARVRGQIMQILFEEGNEIGADKLLFVIDDAPFKADLMQAKGQLLTWEAKLEAAEQKIKIYEPLEKKGTISKDELIQVVSAKNEAVGGKETAKGKIAEADNNIKYCQIKSPMAGKIGEPALKVGAMVNSAGSENVLTSSLSISTPMPTAGRRRRF
jgi:multidrug efflux system membrane fusion protein